WKKKREQRLDRFQQWCEQNMPAEHKATRPVFYPFAGADFITISTIYPNAPTYIMAGLEPEGVPGKILQDLEKNPDGFVHKLEQSLDDILSLSFFKTIDMHS